MRIRFWCLAAAVLVVSATPETASAQALNALPSDAEKSLRKADAGYWKAFNACDAQAMGAFLADDLEFYHDKGGVTRTRTDMVEATMKGICGNPNERARRAPIVETIRFDAIPGYGGVLSGRHRFYLAEKGMPERLSGTASFDMLWRYDGAHWLLTRAFSLDHQPVAYAAPSPGIVLSPKALERYVGSYRMGKAEILISMTDGHLILTIDNLKLTLAAKSADHFYAIERPLQFDFAGKPGENATTITVVENGAPVETGTRVD